jgi:hypothetical protein
VIRADNGQNQFFNDKESVTADPPQSTVPHGFAIAFIKSTDGGETWTSPHIVDQMDTVTVTDPNTGQPLRTADFDAAPAVDPVTGQLYLVWQDARGTTGPNGKGAYSRILFTTSTNGGDTWSDPVAVSNIKSAPRGGNLATVAETHVTGPFNFLAAPNAGGYFLGDYEGLAANGTSFVGVDDITNCNTASCGSNPTDTYAFGLR